MNLQAYESAHSALALLDASALTGRVFARGADALDLLHRMSTNDLTPLFGKPGVGAQTLLTTEKGRIVDLLTVIAESDRALLVTSRGTEQRVIEWLDKFVIMEDAKFEIATASISHLLIFGQSALGYLSFETGADLIALENFHSLEVTIGSIAVRLQKSYRIIESGFSLFCDAKDTEALMIYLSEGIESLGGAVIDSDTFDTLRIEAGIPIAPNELNEKHNPLETSLVHAVSFTKGCYIGQEVIARLDSYDKVQRHMMGVQLANQIDSAEMPMKVTSADGTEIGEVTSFTYSPKLLTSIGLAFIKTAFANPNSTVSINGTSAQLIKLPFETES